MPNKLPDGWYHQVQIGGSKLPLDRKWDLCLKRHEPDLGSMTKAVTRMITSTLVREWQAKNSGHQLTAPIYKSITAQGRTDGKFAEVYDIACQLLAEKGVVVHSADIPEEFRGSHVEEALKKVSVINRPAAPWRF